MKKNFKVSFTIKTINDQKLENDIIKTFSETVELEDEMGLAEIGYEYLEWIEKQYEILSNENDLLDSDEVYSTEFAY